MYALRQEANGLLFGAPLLAGVLGVVVGQAPGIAVAVTSLGIFLAWLGHISQGSRPWETLTFFVLAGYVVLSYGFANLTLPLIQIPLLVGHVCAFGVVLLVGLERSASIRAFLWVGLQWQTLKRLLGGLRRYTRVSFVHDVVFWCFLFYVLGLFVASVQPWLEVLYAAIPFSLIVGFALGASQHEDLNCPQPLRTTRR